MTTSILPNQKETTITAVNSQNIFVRPVHWKSIVMENNPDLLFIGTKWDSIDLRPEW